MPKILQRQHIQSSKEIFIRILISTCIDIDNSIVLVRSRYEMNQVEYNFLDIVRLLRPNNNIKPMIPSIIKFSTERSMRFDTNDHFVRRLL